MLLPHLIMPDELECDQSVVGSIVVLTLSNPPILIHPLPPLGTYRKRDRFSTGALKKPKQKTKTTTKQIKKAKQNTPNKLKKKIIFQYILMVARVSV